MPFPSVPRGVLMEMLHCTGVGPHTRDIVKDIYTNSTMCVRTANGMTAPIRFNKGVKQGCPLSPILFNFNEEGSSTTKPSTGMGEDPDPVAPQQCSEHEPLLGWQYSPGSPCQVFTAPIGVRREGGGEKSR